MTRTPEAPIDPLFVRRWSPRAMSGEAATEQELRTLFEAARWAPSSGNFQPWRFVFARRDTPEFARFFDLLAEGNKPWCERAGALVLVAARLVDDKGGKHRTAPFDTGAAWMSLALQGTIMGLVIHGMEGFDYDRAAEAIKLPDDHAVQCMIAIGHPGKVDELPEKYQSREQPSTRHVETTFVFEGGFPDVPPPAPKQG